MPEIVGAQEQPRLSALLRVVVPREYYCTQTGVCTSSIQSMLGLRLKISHAHESAFDVP